MARKKRLDPKLPIADGGVDSDAKADKFFRNLTQDDVWAWLQQPDVYGDRLVRRLNELFLEFDGGSLSVYDEGTYLGEADGLNFTGAGVTVESSTTLPVGIFDVDIPGGGGGGGGDTIEAEADEDIAAGQFVAVFDDSGTPKCRVADCSAGQGYQADGFAKEAFSTGETVTIYLPGAVNVAGGTGLTPGDVWLGDDGYATSTPPTTAGYISQQIGVAETDESVAFEPQPDILIEDVHAVGTINGGFLKTITFTSSGTLNVPTGVTGGWITAVGGGGGGSSRTSALGGGGGGAGELICMQPVEVVSGAAYTVTIGAAGSGGNAAAGGDGGDTIFAAVQTWTAKGGKGGTSGGAGGNGGGFNGGAGGTSGGGAGNPGAVGGLESVAFYGGSSGGAGAGSTAQPGGAGGASGGANAGSTGGATASSQGGGGGGGSTIYGLGGNGGAGGSGGSTPTAYGAGGGGAGGLTGSSATGGNGVKGYFLFMYVG